jgi:hypothetical protein
MVPPAGGDCGCPHVGQKRDPSAIFDPQLMQKAMKRILTRAFVSE